MWSPVVLFGPQLKEHPLRFDDFPNNLAKANPYERVGLFVDRLVLVGRNKRVYTFGKCVSHNNGRFQESVYKRFGEFHSNCWRKYELCVSDLFSLFCSKLRVLI